MMRGALIAAAMIVTPAAAQPAGDTAKYQQTILNLRACIRANAPPANIAGIKTYDAAFRYFLGRCYPPFSSKLAQLGASDLASDLYRTILLEEWAAFGEHLGGR